jgi:hypothetical protein
MATEKQTASTQQTASAAESPTPASAPAVVDPSPTQAPITLSQESLQDVLTRYPAAASSSEVLALRPNRYEDATTGPDRQISMTLYTHWRKPDGSDFIAPVGNAETYERKGYTRGADEDIPDLVAYLAERAGKPAT